MSLSRTPGDIQCRACMGVNFEGVVDMCYVLPKDGKTLYDYFNECTQLEASSIDNLPKILCINCTDNLQAAYNFMQAARRSDKELKRMMALQKAEAELMYAPTETTVQTVPMDFEVYSNNASPETECTESKFTFPSMVIPEDKEYIIVDDIKADICEKSEDNTFLYEDSEASTQDEEEIIDVLLNDNANYICDVCSEKYGTKYQMKKHILEQHKDEIICKQCPKIFELPRELRLHSKLVHMTDSSITCPWCKVPKLLPRSELINHVQTVHKESYLKYFPHKRMHIYSSDGHFDCKRCSKSFTSIYELADHIQDHKYNCPICLTSFKREKAYKAHFKQMHVNSISGMKAMLFGNDGDNSKNMPVKSSDELRPPSFQCSMCPRQFKLERSLQLHMKIKHKLLPISDDEQTSDNVHKTPIKKRNSVKTTVRATDKEFVECKHCHKEILASKIGVHEEKHALKFKNKRTYICSFCPREFPYEQGVILHEKNMHLHEKPKRQDCPICHKQLDAGYLKRHLEYVHTAERNFDCDICHVKYKNKYQVMAHRRLHSQRNIPCSVCNKKFVSPYDLKVHMRFHTGESPYACHLCDKRFSIRAHLTYHLQKHAGVKRICNDCGQEFNSIKQLKIHSYKHTGAMPYRCTVCKYGCALRDVFRKHLLRVHNMTMTETELCAMFKANTGRNPIVQTLEELQSEATQTKNVEYST